MLDPGGRMFDNLGIFRIAYMLHKYIFLCSEILTNQIVDELKVCWAFKAGDIDVAL